ncbi:putative cadherin-7-like [Triplophysa rosa]|uniref:Cadherin-7-like n=1 Tax=Triplophysa rosa TaxID=992332 RepID=A0A9W7T872_TRIRA|nr:putative cadherin-7-like [Triplophysa rosa]
MYNCSVIRVLLIVIFISSGWLKGNLQISKHQQHKNHSTKASHVSQQRVKRGWIWSQIFVEEEDPTVRKIGQLKSDYDTGDFTIKYILSGEGAGELFIIDEYTGDIQVIKRLDREQKDFYILQAQAINRRSKQPTEPESEFIIKVQDINDNAPEFINEPYVSSIPEMCPTAWWLNLNLTNLGHLVSACPSCKGFPATISTRREIPINLTGVPAVYHDLGAEPDSTVLSTQAFVRRTKKFIHILNNSKR